MGQFPFFHKSDGEEFKRRDAECAEKKQEEKILTPESVSYRSDERQNGRATELLVHLEESGEEPSGPENSSLQERIYPLTGGGNRMLPLAQLEERTAAAKRIQGEG
jgi:hypothetical protein